MYAGLADFVDALSAAGELRRISGPVNPILDIAAAADQASKLPAPRLPHQTTRVADPHFHHLGGPALLFENVQGSDIPVLINAFGSYRRVEMAMGCEAGGIASIAARLAELVKPEPPQGLADAFAKLRKFLPLLRIPPKRQRGSGACQQVVIKGDDVDLTRLPLIRCWPLDGDFASLGYPAGINDHAPGLGRGPDWDANHRGRYITLGGIHTVHADDRDHPKPPSHNIGMYRVQLLGPRRMAMHWHMHHDGARHWRSWKKLGQPMPVAVALGGESVLPYAATAPLPPGISELLMAGFLNGRGIPMVRAKTVPLWVPANAEIVIEGFVSHEAGHIGWNPLGGTALQSRDPLGPGAVFEGPFGDHTGFYSMPDRYPIFDVTAITMRRNPIYPTTVVGLPPQEDYFLGKATERIFLPLLKTLIHDIDDYDLPLFGAFHNCAALRIDKAYPLQARRVMHSVWGAGQMAWTKNLFVVDKDVDVHDTRAVLRAAAEHCHPARDTETVNGPLDVLDHAAPRIGAGMKIGFDCTRKVAGEEVGGIAVVAGACSPSLQHSRVLAGISAVIQSANHEGWLIVKIDKQRPGDGARAIDAILAAIDKAHEPPPPFIIVLAGDVDAADLDRAFFHWCAHTDASRDTFRFVTRSGHHVLAFDSTPKLPGDERHGQPVRPWPPLQTFPAETIARARQLLSP